MGEVIALLLPGVVVLVIPFAVFTIADFIGAAVDFILELL